MVTVIIKSYIKHICQGLCKYYVIYNKLVRPPPELKTQHTVEIWQNIKTTPELYYFPKSSLSLIITYRLVIKFISFKKQYLKSNICTAPYERQNLIIGFHQHNKLKTHFSGVSSSLISFVVKYIFMSYGYNYVCKVENISIG